MVSFARPAAPTITGNDVQAMMSAFPRSSFHSFRSKDFIDQPPELLQLAIAIARSG